MGVIMKKSTAVQRVLVAAGVVLAGALGAGRCEAHPNLRPLTEAASTKPGGCSCRNPFTGVYSKATINMGAPGAVGPTGWKTTGGVCPNPGNPCATSEVGDMIYDGKYEVPQGKCFVGLVEWTLISDGPDPLPACGGTPQPTCPEATHTYTLVMDTTTSGTLVDSGPCGAE